MNWVPARRDYKRSTVFALATLGEGRCYWPQPPCNAPVTVIIDGEPVTNLQIAHIRAASPNGPRYVEEMSDNERRSWNNLILLCTPHHNMIDKLRPNDYSINDLEQWKSQRESGGLTKLQGLRDLTEDRLQDMLASSMKEAHKEIREILAEQRSIDSDAAMLLSEAARNINMETAETLHQASSLLAPVLAEYAELLYSAAEKLGPALDEHAAQLYQASETLGPTLDGHVESLSGIAGSISGLIEELDIRIRELRDLRDDM